MPVKKESAAGYILRISRKEWVKQVFERTKYYVGIRRKWKPGQTILFVHKTLNGDAFIGYGVVNSFQSLEELTESEKAECEEWGWRGAIDFKYVVRFEKPVLVKETPLGSSKLKGKYLHGVKLSKAYIDSVLAMAE